MLRELSQVYDQRKGLFYTTELWALKTNETFRRTISFEKSKTNPLFLLNSAQLDEVVKHNESRLKYLQFKRFKSLQDNLKQKNINLKKEDGDILDKLRVKTKYGLFRKIMLREKAKKKESETKVENFFMTSAK